MLPIAWTILEPGESTATKGDFYAAKSTMAIMLLRLFFTLPHLQQKDQAQLFTDLYFVLAPCSSSAFHFCLPRSKPSIPGTSIFPKLLQSHGPERKDLFFSPMDLVRQNSVFLPK